jgi:hypothetical protein
VLGIDDACSVLPGCWTADPVQVPGLSDIVDVAGLGDTVLALDSAGQVHGWGDNWNGQLAGATTSLYSATPLPLPGLDGVASIAPANWSGRAVKR